MAEASCCARRRWRSARLPCVTTFLAYEFQRRKSRGTAQRQTNSITASPGKTGRGIKLREQPLLPHHALREQGSLGLSARSFRVALAIGSPRAADHHRYGRRTENRAA